LTVNGAVDEEETTVSSGGQPQAGGLRIPRSAWEDFLASSTVRPTTDRQPVGACVNVEDWSGRDGLAGADVERRVS